MLMKSTRRKAMDRSALGMAASLTLASGQAVALDGKTYSPNSVQNFVPNMKGQMTIVEVWYVAATSTSSDNNINTSIVYPSDNSVFIYYSKVECEKAKPADTDVTTFACELVLMKANSPD